MGDWLLRRSAASTARRANSVLAMAPSGVAGDYETVVGFYEGPGSGRSPRSSRTQRRTRCSARHGWVVESHDEDTAFERTSNWLDALLEELGLSPERTVLAGFSQGAVMSYALGLAASRPRPAAILAMSGFIPRVEGFELDLASRAGLPVSISHGTTDPVIGVQWGRDARDRLTPAGLVVRYHEDPVDHTITPQAIAQAREVLEAALPPA